MGGQMGASAGGFGGRSSGQLSAQGSANTNGPNAADREFGQDRATTRNSMAANSRARENAASQLGGLNAAHASDNARANAASGSRVGAINTYETQMKSALAMSNQTERNAAITRARQQLAQNSNKTLTAGAVTRLDSTLDLKGASPELGTSP
jgi:hypothetical protein